MPDQERPVALNAETYLGDGVYASFDGTYIWLRAPRHEGDHLVAIEPEVLMALNGFAVRVWPPKVVPA